MKNECFYADKYLVDRPTVAKIVNEEDYDRGDEEFGDVEIVFEDGESYETIWPGNYKLVLVFRCLVYVLYMNK